MSAARKVATTKPINAITELRDLENQLVRLKALSEVHPPTDGGVAVIAWVHFHVEHVRRVLEAREAES